ncbi:hypothetical protein [Streptomyces sp. NPDC050560]|uniref:hypothetical protein n=1 Tax=Streptomyces sp. NPDC050560 TaxID=3365630 RepID=UPI0037A3FCC0
MSTFPTPTSASPLPHPASRPLPHGDTPPRRPVPPFSPVRVRARGAQHRALCRVRRHRGRALAAGLAMSAAALIAATASADAGAGAGAPARDAPHAPPPAAGPVRAPVRIADGATARMLRPGDRVDVIAADGTGGGAEPRVVAGGARVVEVPSAGSPAAPAEGTDTTEPAEGTDDSDDRGDAGGVGGADLTGTGAETEAERGTLVVLSVPRATAARLAGAGATSQLAVTLC